MKLVYKCYALGIILMLLAQGSFAQGIKFTSNKSWQEIRKQAQAEGKYIFADVYATWCGPCITMDKEVYPLQQAGDYFNARFISIKVQLDSSKNDNIDVKAWYAEAKRFKDSYGVSSLPGYLFFSPNGTLIHKSTGLKSVDSLIADAERAIIPAKRYDLLLAEYEKGKRDADFVRALTRTASELGQKAFARKMAQEYINGLSEMEMFQPDNILFMIDFTKTSTDRGFAFLRDNALKIQKTNPGIKLVNFRYRVLRVIYEEDIQPFSNSKNGKADWDLIKRNLTKHGALGDTAMKIYRQTVIFKSEVEPFVSGSNVKPDWNKIAFDLKPYGNDGEELLLRAKMFFGLNKKDLAMVYANGPDYFKKYAKPNTAGTWNDAAWFMFEYATDEKQLLEAAKWAKFASEKDPKNPDYPDTYASLLYKAGKRSEALIAYEKVLAIPFSNQKGFKETYQRMKENKRIWPNIVNGEPVYNLN